MEYTPINPVILVGSGAATRYAFARLLAEGHKVQIEQQPMSGEYIITAPERSVHLIKIATMHYHNWSPSKPKPKHSNGKCNQVNRNKNKSSRKARKQNRR